MTSEDVQSPPDGDGGRTTLDASLQAEFRQRILEADAWLRLTLVRHQGGGAVRESLRPILIRDAGGVAVLAHPFTLNLKTQQLHSLLIELRAAGLAGIEVFYPEHNADMQREYQNLAKDMNLVATGGSDFHGAMSPDIRMGSGFGSLRIPDEIVARLEARKP